MEEKQKAIINSFINNHYLFRGRLLQIKNLLKEEMGNISFTTWINPLEIKEMTDKKITLWGPRSNKWFSIQRLLLFILLFVFLGFRGGFAEDYKGYSGFFERLCLDISLKIHYNFLQLLLKYDKH